MFNLQKVRDMPLDDVVILDIDKQEIELHGDTLDDVDYLPQDAVSRGLIVLPVGGDAAVRTHGRANM